MIQNIIGEHAEHLAYLFCAINRQELFEQSKYNPPYPVKDRFTGAIVEISQEDFSDLFEIEIANFVEQVPSKDELKTEKLPWYVEYFGRCHKYVSRDAYQSYKTFFEI